MGISLARARRVGQQRTTGKKLAKEYAAQQKKAQKRKGISGLLGKGLGMGLGSLLAGGLGIASGGLLMPLVMAAGSFGGRKMAHEMTRGMGAKTGGLKGDMYGYGEDEAMSLKKDLESQMAVDPLKEKGGFGKDLLSSYVSAGMAGNLGGVGKALKGKGTEGLLMGTSTDAAGNVIVGSGSKGLEGMGAGLGDLFGGSTVKSDAVDPSTIDLEASLEGSGLSLEQYNEMKDTAQANYIDDADDWFGGGDAVVDYSGSTGIDESGNPYSMAQGGQVPQQELLALLALAQMQQEQTAYSGTPLEEKQPSIADMFASKGKTLGGNDTQSLSQKLGR
jgi:hypothetical protein